MNKKKIKKLLNTTGTLKLNNLFVLERKVQHFSILTNRIEACDYFTVKYISPDGPKHNTITVEVNKKRNTRMYKDARSIRYGELK